MATVPGWKRFDAAEEWLQRNNDLAQKRDPAGSRSQFNEFIRARGFQNAVMTSEQRIKPFGGYLEWTRTRERGLTLFAIEHTPWFADCAPHGACVTVKCLNLRNVFRNFAK